MLDKFKAFFRGGVYESTKKNFYPIGTGRRVWLTRREMLSLLLASRFLLKTSGRSSGVCTTRAGILPQFSACVMNGRLTWSRTTA